MSDEIKQKVQPIYKQLQGYLGQAPTAEKGYYEYNSFYWTTLNNCIEQLNKITGDDYSQFQVTVIPMQEGDDEKIERNEYRMQINGLIMYLKGTYFPEESDPFGGNPLVSVNQSQNVQVTMLLEFTTLIDKVLYGENGKNLKPEEKTFLEKVKNELPSVKTAAELLATVIKMAKDSGLDIHAVAKLFGWT